jgi:hypothetical protein
MKKRNALRLRELAQACVDAAAHCTDVDAASTLLEVSSNLVEMANGKAKSQNQTRLRLLEGFVGSRRVA